MNNNTENKPRTKMVLGKTNIVSSDIVFKSKYFFIKRVEFERNGKKFVREIEERTPVVLIVPYTENFEIYLEKQYRTTYMKEITELVAGQIDPQEDVQEAAKRELKEETGLEAAVWKKVATWHISSNIFQTIHVFFATKLTKGEHKLEEDEIIETIKVPLEEALKKIQEGEITVGSHVAALLLFDKMKREGKL